MLDYKKFANRTGWLLVALLLVGVLLAACGGAPAADNTAGNQADPTEAVAEAPAEQSEPATEEAQPTPPATPTEATAAESAGEPASAASAPVAECQPVDIPDNPLIAAVTDVDWAKGPAGAPIKLVEYGDFQ